MTKNGVYAKVGQVQGRPQQGLDMFPTIAKSVEEQNNFDVVQVDWTHVHKTSVHGDDLIGAIPKGEVQIVVEIEGLLQ
jgi:hypothetical protein